MNNSLLILFELYQLRISDKIKLYAVLQDTFLVWELIS